MDSPGTATRSVSLIPARHVRESARHFFSDATVLRLQERALLVSSWQKLSALDTMDNCSPLHGAQFLLPIRDQAFWSTVTKLSWMILRLPVGELRYHFSWDAIELQALDV
jgi:hypothetical protein